ncbi:MAG: hypothetical protein GY798_00615 [Hyphomicrobiales bacterium]|nr:hypothetical protein [Hyphomicrobiales bacterium]
MLARLDAAAVPSDMNLPGYHFHQLDDGRYSVRVTGNWRITFGWDDDDATDVSIEDYH